MAKKKSCRGAPAMNGAVPGIGSDSRLNMTISPGGGGKFSATEGVVSHPLKDKQLRGY